MDRGGLQRRCEVEQRERRQREDEVEVAIDKPVGRRWERLRRDEGGGRCGAHGGEAGRLGGEWARGERGKEWQVAHKCAFGWRSARSAAQVWPEVWCLASWGRSGETCVQVEGEEVEV